MDKRVETLKKLRDLMKETGVTYYYVTTADYHGSEYVNDFFKEREFLSGFTGSNGNLLVGQDFAGLWTDGRYFIQAEKELQGSEIALYRMGEEGVPTVNEFLKCHCKDGDVIGFDGRTISLQFGKALQKELGEGITLADQQDLADSLWENRPSMPANPLVCFPEEIYGASLAEKLEQVRAEMKKENCQCFVSSKLDDNMWLLNLRGNDVECNPVALSYVVVTEAETYFFVQDSAMTPVAKERLDNYHIHIKPYEEIMTFLETAKIPKNVLVDQYSCSFTFYRILEKSHSVKVASSPIVLLKGIKNPVELQHMEQVYLEDSAALTKFICYMKTKADIPSMNEYTAAMLLDDYRRALPEFQDLSFPTISGFKENAAMMHYEATADNAKRLEREGMLLVDSGGQYPGGTTDVTRTFALGPVDATIKEHFTLVAKGMLALTHAKFLYGCTGRNVDILARQPLWEKGIDYKCGTGHGVGYDLNVHEGPQNIRWKFLPEMKEAVLEPGMVVTNEPGVYIEGSHGIRTENVMVVKTLEKNGDGQFLGFDTLTYVPIDRELIIPELLGEIGKKQLNEYHQQVYDKISPYLSSEEKNWLQEVTAPIL